MAFELQMQEAARAQQQEQQRRDTISAQTQAELKRNYRLLKKAFKEEREFRASLETELMTKV
eukprot:CAMPEP_0185575370 /NCGR_PEP_ID=MMETSP0434-20130131/6585_1 /TAXON_ID=626734 ORGANISM="Favella taraikaensis, Strain Fe Narragansett Bay" /NCGR_SAMPLE_ID=MMETSP0434 /ASSEMBLY_ACC=CAM_ASM_000379 /LENGTH=61 /DNA_ID=CAMNT_0028192235 /DNA_START=35 /DNA_END=220 /DNA_ORIENTATION=+